MDKKENIVLDAVLKAVISDAVFDAELENGHIFTAFYHQGDTLLEGPAKVEEKVSVEFSPYDMTKARICSGVENRI